ncbi:tetratricopeptide repeat protein [Nakamurella sp. YIM 132087]|uniref:Tetratricopeptide repeat protein n=1 Tax=Nakamurella alba TaxID=2665158 RepID=A0A7K1FV56_9ACTN|nr:tetratricopeptide repeat protein [Nakamurella alba]MTD16714.1 tetratricopeptide repeat protein [Nakamurella alba]
MTRPDPRQQAAMSAAFAGAVDLSALANRPAAPPAGAAAPAGPAGAEPSPFVMAVTEADFSDVLQASAQLPIVFDLWSPRSPVSAQLSPMLAALAAKGHGAWVLAQVDVDTNPRIAQAFQVQQIPTVMAVAAGQPVDGFSGQMSEPELKKWIASLLDALRDRLPGIRAAEQAAADAGELEAEPEDPRFTAAEDLLAAGDYEAARAAYQKILDVEPANAEAAAALAQVVFLARVDQHPQDATALADAAPDDVALQGAAADLALAAGDPQAAFDRLIATVRRTVGDDKAAAREWLVGLFALFPADDDLVRVARRQLAAALY